MKIRTYPGKTPKKPGWRTPGWRRILRLDSQLRARSISRSHSRLTEDLHGPEGHVSPGPVRGRELQGHRRRPATRPELWLVPFSKGMVLCPSSKDGPCHVCLNATQTASLDGERFWCKMVQVFREDRPFFQPLSFSTKKEQIQLTTFLQKATELEF